MTGVDILSRPIIVGCMNRKTDAVYYLHRCRS